MELSFCDLRAKEVINICDGRRLGNIIDLIIDCRCARVIGIVVPCERGFFSFFKSNQDIFIPWHRICKIGRDVILVELTPANIPSPPYVCAAPQKISAYTANEKETTTTVNDNINLNNFNYNTYNNADNNTNNT